jgi:hypothetical protein
MGPLKFLTWTALCLAVGVGLGTVEFGGSTATQHAQKLWKQRGPRLDQVRDGASDLVDDVKKKVASSKEPAAPVKDAAGTPPTAHSGPTEQHSPSERSAIDQIIARRQK